MARPDGGSLVTSPERDPLSEGRQPQPRAINMIAFGRNREISSRGIEEQGRRLHANAFAKVAGWRGQWWVVSSERMFRWTPTQ
jgi:hypothetical protein